ncbi:cytochrome c3 family protein [bacterium]|nr:cytochrome c3 family protein [bacterium]MBU1652992.1 cytochrome c3 family protein [bacterium]MBU1882176.1 cytochrome c3 family protein [bacterium]
MKSFLKKVIVRTSFIVMAAATLILPVRGFADSCLDCHLELEDEAALSFKVDVHNIDGVSCAGCHGGDPASDDQEIAMDSRNGFVGAPNPLEIPQFCGKCHSDPAYMRQYNPSLATDQVDKYWTSHHGKLNRSGDEKAAQCSSCHGVHEMRPPSDPRSMVYSKNVPQTCSECHADADYMAKYQISVSQFQDYQGSVHGVALLEKNDLGAPACNDCHGNHAAMPPGISSIGRVCFQCHLAEGELFSQSPHKVGFDELGVPECAFCHGHHAVHALTDENIGVEQPSICLQCHSEGEAGYEAASTMKNEIIKLKKKYEDAETLIADAARKGIEVSDEQFELRNVRQSLINLRKLIHAFNPDSVVTTTESAMEAANEVYLAGVQSTEEVKTRRTGFLIFSVITLILVAILYVIVRKKTSYH